MMMMMMMMIKNYNCKKQKKATERKIRSYYRLCTKPPCWLMG